MLSKYLRFFAFITLALAGAIGAWFLPGYQGVANAQTPNPKALYSIEVDLWPEYDRQAVLVIYRVTLSSGISLPTDVTLRIPAAAGEPNAVAAKDAQGNLFSITYKREVSGEWSLITFSATMPEIQMEYYDPGLVKENKARHFEYNWPGDYSADAFTIQVQQPLGVQKINITPALGTGVTGQDGLTYFTSQLGKLTQGQTFNLTIDYEKSSDALSAENLEVKPSASIPTITSKQRSIMTFLPWLLGGLGVVLIVGSVLWYWLAGKGQIRPFQPQFRRRKKTANSEESGSAEKYVYCQQCGKRALANDRFCRVCGARLKLEKE